MHVGLEGLLGADAHEPRVIVRGSNRRVALAVDKPVAVVSHWTYSGASDRHGHDDSLNLATSIQGGAGPSWHLLIDRDGTIIQSVPFTKGAIHCKGRLPGHLGGHVVNASAVGIELENMGRVMRAGGIWHPVSNPVEPPERHKPDRRFVIPNEHVDEAHGGHWHAYTDAQAASFELVLRALVAWGAPLTAESCALGHVDLDPSRKADPGPCWLRDILPSVLSRVFGAAVCGTAESALGLGA